ncbi:glycosyltransferase family 2 protein [Candidatus Woesearchaeota archaeon]|nr:glycosyltransferase family 2 protein [Candidatus Woesearchaeota archaeon]
MDDAKKPRVLVGCVTHDKDECYLNDLLGAIRSQDFRNFDILFVETAGNDEYAARLRGTGAIVLKCEEVFKHSIERITYGRNAVREYAIRKGYDYIWFVDTDVLPPQDALSRMISEGKDIVAGLCLVSVNVEGVTKILPNIYRPGRGECLVPFPIGDVMNDDVIEISCAGFGCVLLSSKVLEAVNFRFFQGSMAGEDMAFFNDAREKGFRSFADNGVKCMHRVFPPGDPRNKRFMFMEHEKGD